MSNKQRKCFYNNCFCLWKFSNFAKHHLHWIGKTHTCWIKLQNLRHFYIWNNFKTPSTNSRNSPLLSVNSASFLVHNTLHWIELSPPPHCILLCRNPQTPSSLTASIFGNISWNCYLGFCFRPVSSTTDVFHAQISRNDSSFERTQWYSHKLQKKKIKGFLLFREKQGSSAAARVCRQGADISATTRTPWLPSSPVRKRFLQEESVAGRRGRDGSPLTVSPPHRWWSCPWSPSPRAGSRWFYRRRQVSAG